MPRLFFTVPTRVKVFLLALMLLPCVPGTLFLLAGWLRRQHAPQQDTYAARQANMLYQAGIAALGVGGLCGVAVGWKIIRRRDGE